ncbi:MAG: M24 family metallopeptidase [Rhodobacteraceae bacterium]|jgi:Xaa-Pro aminopeptidase|nr:M24 family metallopeptidase [Paracoccaceae bacterium]
MRLIESDWPDFGLPEPPPPLSRVELADRLAATRAAMAARGLGALLVWGDREHFATLRWLSGFDPRFEEAFLVVLPEGPPALAVGNECLGYAPASPAVAAGDIGVIHCPSLSLLSQPRHPGLRLDAAIRATVPAGVRLGTAGWKYWEEGEVDDPAGALDLPAVMADLLRARAGRVENATDLFMHPGHGLRARVGAADIARMEHANGMAARALRRMVFALREGMTDFAAVEAAAVGGLPLGCHPTFATGARAALGLTGPTGEVLRHGAPVAFNICHWGANICRAGWLAEGPQDMPAAARDYLEAFVAPYLAATARWLALMRPGVTGGQVWAEVMARLPAATFGVTLNPGHLIGDDEWVSSPVGAGSPIPMASGMAMQCDIIPAHPLWFSTRMEDGYVIADDALRAAIARDFPRLAARAAARARFMDATAGLEVPDTLLPLADTCGVLAPFLLSPRRIATLR